MAYQHETWDVQGAFDQCNEYGRHAPDLAPAGWTTLAIGHQNSMSKPSGRLSIIRQAGLVGTSLIEKRRALFDSQGPAITKMQSRKAWQPQ
jgi:hypothetical protein